MLALPRSSQAPAGDVAPEVTVLVWSTDRERAEVLAAAVEGPGRAVRPLADDAALARAWRSAHHGVLVAEDGPRLDSQRAFLHLPLILVRVAGAATTRVGRQAYATVRNAAEAALAVDRFAEHQHLAAVVAARRAPPRCCARCGRGYDALKVRGSGTARRFVKIGAVALCGGCLDELRRLLRETHTPFVEAGTPRPG